MPAPIEGGFISFLTPYLQAVFAGIEVWDGEIPRFNTSGQPIEIDMPLPAFRIVMTEAGFNRKWTQADPYADMGDLNFEGWATTRLACMTMLSTIEAPLVSATLIQNVSLPGGPRDNPYEVFQCLFKNWTCIQIEGVRTPGNNLIYYGRITFEVGVHGAINTE